MSSAGLAPQPSYGSHPFGFEKEYWLSAKVPLTDATPIATVNRFCIDHGFYMWELGGSTAHEQRRALYKLLEKQAKARHAADRASVDEVRVVVKEQRRKTQRLEPRVSP